MGDLGIFENEEELRIQVDWQVNKYRQMEQSGYGGSILREVRWQYREMADGGDGGDLGFIGDNGAKTCRGVNYPGYPDRFFLAVMVLMGWHQ